MHKHAVLPKNFVGSWIITVFGIIGFIVSLYNYYAASSGIQHTAGAELVIITTLVIAVLSILTYALRKLHTRWQRVVLYIVTIGFLLGTIFAAYLLESTTLVVALLIAVIGWFIQILTK